MYQIYEYGKLLAAGTVYFAYPGTAEDLLIGGGGYAHI